MRRTADAPKASSAPSVPSVFDYPPNQPLVHVPRGALNSGLSPRTEIRLVVWLEEGRNYKEDDELAGSIIGWLLGKDIGWHFGNDVNATRALTAFHEVTATKQSVNLFRFGMGTKVQIKITVEEKDAQAMLDQIKGFTNMQWLVALGLHHNQPVGMVRPYIDTKWPPGGYGYDHDGDQDSHGVEFTAWF